MTYTVVAVIDATIPSGVNTIANTVTIAAIGDTNPANNTATDVDALPPPDCCRAIEDGYYPTTSGPALTQVAFNESDILAAGSTNASAGPSRSSTTMSTRCPWV